jgi:hypothetical protein
MSQRAEATTAGTGEPEELAARIAEFPDALGAALEQRERLWAQQEQTLREVGAWEAICSQLGSGGGARLPQLPAYLSDLPTDCAVSLDGIRAEAVAIGASLQEMERRHAHLQELQSKLLRTRQLRQNVIIAVVTVVLLIVVLLVAMLRRQ